MSGGFTDLRLNNGRQGEDSFWPSFTDIMTVIVMIFLLAMVTLLLKNMDLLQQLRSSLEAERSAALQIQSTSDTNLQLKQRLAQMEKESSIIRMRLMDLSEEHRQSVAELDKSRKSNSSMQARLEQLSAEKERLNAGISQLRSDKTALLASKAELERQQELDRQARLALESRLDEQSTKLSTLQQQYQLSEEELATLRALFKEQEDELSSLKSSQSAQLGQFRQLEQEYASLEKKYNRLIRPARSAVGKHVVQVRYQKQGGKLLIQMKAPADEGFANVSEKRLHQRLTAIHGKHRKDLYIKIIFPDDSGLSYTEAWNLTEALLRRYDYYYREP